MKKQYEVAVCACGVLGLITSEGKEEVTYSSGKKAFAYTGIVLQDKIIQGFNSNAGKLINVKKGNPWSSQKPEILFIVNDIDLNQDNISIANQVMEKINNYLINIDN